MEPFTLGWTAEKLGANLPEGAAERVVRGICTDTRNDAQDTLFFALKGETSDGHEYISKAFEKGAVAAIVSELQDNIEGVQIVVPDTLKALGNLAHAYRMQFKIPVVGITGSVGKTSTKEMTAAVLRTKYNVLANEKNYNNEIGVPLTLFRLEKTHEVAVIEMGMRGLGEIDRLAEIAAPTIGIITNIGYAHIERLGSQEKIAEAKSELLARLPSDGFAVLPANDKFLTYLQSRTPCNSLTFGVYDDVPVEADLYIVENTVVMFGDKHSYIEMDAPGVHYYQNAAAALTVTLPFNKISLQDAADALAKWNGVEGRMTIVQAPNDVTVLDDCYNAGIESMTAALKTLAGYTDYKIAILGEMRELGSWTIHAHEQIGKRVVENSVDLLITIGCHAEDIGKGVRYEVQRTRKIEPQYAHFETTEEALKKIPEFITPGATVLVKGSRAMHMEKIVEAITGQESANAHA